MNFDDWDDKLVISKIREALSQGMVDDAKARISEIDDYSLREEILEVIREYEMS